LTLPRADLSSREFKRILLIKLSAVGDVVQTIPVLNKLRRRYPAAQVDWLATPAVAELLRHNPAIANVMEFARDEWLDPWRLAPFASSARLAARLRAARYDLVLDLQGQLRSAVFARATGAPVRIGFDRPRASVWDATARKFPAQARRHAWQGAREGSWLAYTHRIPLPTIDLHAVDRYLSVGPMLGLDADAADFSFPVPQEAIARIDALMHYYGTTGAKLIALAPSAIWETKRWHGEKFAEVARHFMQSGHSAILVGAPSERAACEDVARLAPGAVNLAGETTLSELAALIRRAAICVTNDSGPMHLAVALDRPVVSIFGPTDAVWIGPYRRIDAVLRANPPCAPCYLRQLSRCMHAHVCMHDVSARAVIERVENVLGKHAGGPSLVAAKANRR
jgi:heptosyltransferase I